MWFLNYCSPFMYVRGSATFAYRFVMYSEIFAMFLIYLFHLVAYRFASGNDYFYYRLTIGNT